MLTLMIFLMCINDVHEGLNNHINLFVEGAKLLRVIKRNAKRYWQDLRAEPEVKIRI